MVLWQSQVNKEPTLDYLFACSKSVINMTLPHYAIFFFCIGCIVVGKGEQDPICMAVIKILPFPPLNCSMSVFAADKHIGSPYICTGGPEVHNNSTDFMVLVLGFMATDCKIHWHRQGDHTE